MNYTGELRGRSLGRNADRRAFLKQGAAIVAAGPLALATGYAQGNAATGPINELIDAFLGLSNFNMVRPSPGGAQLLVEIMRPRSQPSRPGDHFEARSDLWLLTVASGKLRQLTFGGRDASAAWAPIWSPDGNRIAFLSTAGDGVPRANWIDVRTGEQGRFSQDSVDVEVNFGSRSPYFGDGRIWGAWLDSTTFLSALHPEGEMNSAFRAGAGEQVYPRLWQRSRAGEESVTVWDNMDGPVCNRGTRLVRMSVENGEPVTEIRAGAIRAVTLSPSRRRAALVLATGVLAPPNLGRFDREFTFQNLDARVQTGLSLIDVDGGSREVAVGSQSGFRFQSDDDAPRWSGAREHVFAPRFDVGEQGPENFGVVRAVDGENAAALAPARSRRHAELLALSLSHAEARSERDLERRAASTAKSTDFADRGLGLNVQLFALGNRHVVMCSSNEIRLIDLVNGRIVQTMNFGTINVLKSGGFATRNDVAVLKIDGVLQRATIVSGRLALGRVTPPGDGFTPACLLAAGGIVWIERSREGEILWVCDRDGGAWRALTSIPGATKGIASFAIQPYRQTDKGGRAVISSMLLPRGYVASKTYPVILDVYPFRNYTEQTAQAGFNPSNFYDLTAYHLAAVGYVVIRPSLPDFVGDVSGYNPIDYYCALIEDIVRSLLVSKVASPGRIGLRGHSNGGYLALAVAGRSKLISAIVASAPFPDLFTSGERPALSFSMDDCSPNRFYANQIAFAEDPDGPFWRMGAPSYAAFDRYVANSPIYHFSAASPPTLIEQGEYDSKGTADSERAFTRLARLGVPVQLARYWGEGHDISTAGNIRDLLAREKAWFDRHLG